MRTRRDESGSILLLTALLLVTLLGISALAIDIGIAHVNERNTQNGADAAALGAAQDLAKVSGTPQLSTAVADAQALAAQNLPKDNLVWPGCVDTGHLVNVERDDAVRLVRSGLLQHPGADPAPDLPDVVRRSPRHQDPLDEQAGRCLDRHRRRRERCRAVHDPLRIRRGRLLPGLRRRWEQHPAVRRSEHGELRSARLRVVQRQQLQPGRRHRGRRRPLLRARGRAGRRRRTRQLHAARTEHGQPRTGQQGGPGEPGARRSGSVRRRRPRTAAPLAVEHECLFSHLGDERATVSTIGRSGSSSPTRRSPGSPAAANARRSRVCSPRRRRGSARRR